MHLIMLIFKSQLIHHQHVRHSLFCTMSSSAVWKRSLDQTTMNRSKKQVRPSTSISPFKLKHFCHPALPWTKIHPHTPLVGWQSFHRAPFVDLACFGGGNWHQWCADDGGDDWDRTTGCNFERPPPQSCYHFHRRTKLDQVPVTWLMLPPLCLWLAEDIVFLSVVLTCPFFNTIDVVNCIAFQVLFSSSTSVHM